VIRTLRSIASLALLTLATTPHAESELPATLRTIVEGSPLAAARTGILVSTLDTGEVLYAREPDTLLNPASNVKLITSATALARLGPEFRFSTEFLVDRAGAGGELKALYVRGHGDPSMVTERLWGVAGELRRLGLKRVGELVLDESYFDEEHFGPGFDQESSDRAYLAPSGALSLNYNAIEVLVTPGSAIGARAQIALEPDSKFFQVENRTTTVARWGLARVNVSTALRGGREVVVVEGRVPLGARPHAVWRRIDDPALYFGHTLAQLLEQRGVKVGRIRLARAPEGAKLLYLSQSDELAEIVFRLNKTSNNFTAEQLLKVLGAEFQGVPGTVAKGVEVAEGFLEELGITRGSYLMRNGSGLNDANRFSARQLVALLRAMWSRTNVLPEYLVSLPVAARDGTIRWRMDGTAAAGRLRAKTGTLDGVVTLSGYVEDGRGRMLAFSILVNDSPGRPGVVKAVDAVGASLAAAGAPAGQAVAASAAGAVVRTASSGPPASNGSNGGNGADLPKRLATYYALATSGDARNEALLRGALRAATDPIVRAALGECVYLADPDSDSARRAFLDAVSADPEATPRLWALLPGLEPGPVVASLADLAADGEGEALRKLLELASRDLADARLAMAVGDALAGVAASAPDDVLVALRAAPPPLFDAAAARLAAGIARSDEKEHPFPALLRGLAAKDDPQAEMAKGLLTRLDEARRAEGARAAPVQGSR
jgi:D-alanyl-D-alanine carboxypeptidase/D-alanyl-D-alanine-endopeptidase (penicillin-binding protein 4)